MASRCWRVRPIHLVCVLAALGQLSTASGEALDDDGPPSDLDLALAVAQPPPRPLAGGALAEQRLASRDPQPGLQFSVDPADEEVFLGWHFEF